MPVVCAVALAAEGRLKGVALQRAAQATWGRPGMPIREGGGGRRALVSSGKPRVLAVVFVSPFLSAWKPVDQFDFEISPGQLMEALVDEGMFVVRVMIDPRHDAQSLLAAERAESVAPRFPPGPRQEEFVEYDVCASIRRQQGVVVVLSS